MKSEIILLESRNDNINTIEDTNRRATSPHCDTTPRTHSFLDSHPIDTTTQDMHPILTPFQCLYPINNHHVKEVEC